MAASETEGDRGDWGAWKAWEDGDGEGKEGTWTSEGVLVHVSVSDGTPEEDDETWAWVGSGRAKDETGVGEDIFVDVKEGGEPVRVAALNGLSVTIPTGVTALIFGVASSPASAGSCEMVVGRRGFGSEPEAGSEIGSDRDREVAAAVAVTS